MKPLTPGEQFIFDWQYDNLDRFRQKLIECIILADDDNLDRLDLAFPIKVMAYLNYRNTPGWWEDVDDRGHGEPQERE